MVYVSILENCTTSPLLALPYGDMRGLQGECGGRLFQIQWLIYHMCNVL